jgi:hypothetical protein
MNLTATAGMIPLVPPVVAPPAHNGRAQPRSWRASVLPNMGSRADRRWGFARLAIAALVLLSISAGYFILGPGRSDNAGPDEIPAVIVPAATPGTPAATATATPFPMTDHPIIGMWLFDNELRQPGTDTSTVAFTESGTFVESSVEFGWIAVGTWRATGERTLEVVDVLQELGPQDMFATDYVPEGNVFAPGMVVHRGVLEVDATGNTVTFTGAVEFRDADGTVQGSGTFESRGTRMVVDPTAVTPTPTP